MLWLNKYILLLICIPIIGLTTTETPMFDPSLSARELGLAKSSFSDNYVNNGVKNPASIVDQKGIAIHVTEFLSVNYSGINFVNQTLDITFGFNYTGSSINDIKRSKINKVDSQRIDEINHIVPYEYHNFGFVTAKKINNISFGLGLNYKQIILDSFTNQSTEGHLGIGIDFLDAFKLGFSIQNIVINNSSYNELQRKHTIYNTAFNYTATKKTKLFLAIIENKNELSTHATFHYGVEHYLNNYLPIRFGLDHNRYTFGFGVFLNPLEIDIGWAQSRSVEVDDQIILSFSYGIEEKNHLY